MTQKKPDPHGPGTSKPWTSRRWSRSVAVCARSELRARGCRRHVGGIHGRRPI